MWWVEIFNWVCFVAVQVSPKITNKQDVTEIKKVDQHENVTVRVEYSVGNPSAESKWIVEDTQVDFKINERTDGVSEITAYDVSKDFTLEFKVWNSCGEDRVRVVVHVVGELVYT